MFPSCRREVSRAPAPKVSATWRLISGIGSKARASIGRVVDRINDADETQIGDALMYFGGSIALVAFAIWMVER